MRRVTLVRCTHARGSLNKPFLLCGQLCGTDRLVPGGDTKGSCFVAPEPQPVFPRGTALRTQCRGTRGPLSPTTHKASWGGSRPAHTVLPPGMGARSPQFPRTALGALMRPGQPGNLASNPETHSGPARLSDIHKASARMRFCHLRHPAARWPAAPELCPGPPRVSLHLTADGTQVTRSLGTSGRSLHLVHTTRASGHLGTRVRVGLSPHLPGGPESGSRDPAPRGH